MTEALTLAALRGEGTPRPPPHGEDRRRRGDPQPRDSEYAEASEKEHCECRAEVVKDRAEQEVQMGRRPAKVGDTDPSRISGQAPISQGGSKEFGSIRR